MTEEGIASIRTDLILNRLLEWRVSAFFRCIGQKKHGERLVMDWNRVVGSRGRAHIKPRTYTDRDGNERHRWFSDRNRANELSNALGLLTGELTDAPDSRMPWRSS